MSKLTNGVNSNTDHRSHLRLAPQRYIDFSFSIVALDSSYTIAAIRKNTYKAFSITKQQNKLGKQKVTKR